MLDFLTLRLLAVQVGNTSSTITVNTGTPQVCVLGPLLFTLLTYSCTMYSLNIQFLKFADDTTMVGLISGRDLTNYMCKVCHLAVWCRDNNLSPNVELL